MENINLVIYEGAMCCSTGVCGPEPNKELIELNEALKRLQKEFKELKKQVGIETAMVAVNFLLSKDYGKNRFFNNRRKQQEKYLFEIEQRFNTPILTVPLLEHEPEGLDKLRELGRKIFSG